MSNLYKVLLYMCVMGFAPCAAAQNMDDPIVYTASFTKKIEKIHLDVYEPVESWLHVYPMSRDSFMRYDLVLQNDRNDFEVRYRIRPERGRWKNTPQFVEFQRVLSSIATNDPEADIRLLKPDQAFFEEAFNATDGSIAYFTPKFSFSEKTHGALISITDAGNAAVDIVILYNEDEYDALRSFRHLRFQ